MNYTENDLSFEEIHPEAYDETDLETDVHDAMPEIIESDPQRFADWLYKQCKLYSAERYNPFADLIDTLEQEYASRGTTTAYVMSQSYKEAQMRKDEENNPRLLGEPTEMEAMWAETMKEPS